jgi:hypothetical protein
VAVEAVQAGEDLVDRPRRAAEVFEAPLVVARGVVSGACLGKTLALLLSRGLLCAERDDHAMGAAVGLPVHSTAAAAAQAETLERREGSSERRTPTLTRRGRRWVAVHHAIVG